MYSLTFQYFRAILCDRRSASDVTGRDNAYNYFNIKQNTMKKRVVLLDMLESLCWWKLDIENKMKRTLERVI